jgi:hypothetical protein
MTFANSKHQIQYLFPLQSGAPLTLNAPNFPAVSLTSLTDSICIDLFSQFSQDSSDTSTVAPKSDPAADENHE